MFKIKEKEIKDPIHELELVYDKDGNIDLRIDDKVLMSVFQDGDITCEPSTLNDFGMKLYNWKHEE